MLLKDMITHCANSDITEAYKILHHLWSLGYSCEDIIGNIFRITKVHQNLPEYLKLEFIKVITVYSDVVCNANLFSIGCIGDWVYTYENRRGFEYIGSVIRTCSTVMQENSSS